MEQAMITFADYRSGAIPVRHIAGYVRAWKIDDHVTGLRTYFALWGNCDMARSMQVDLWGKRANSFNFDGQRWLIINAIPDNAKFIGYRRPPVNVEKAKAT